MSSAKKGKGDIACRVIDYARELGFSVALSRGGHLRFVRPGSPIVFFSSTPGDRRSLQNARAKLRRALSAPE